MLFEKQHHISAPLVRADFGENMTPLRQLNEPAKSEAMDAQIPFARFILVPGQPTKAMPGTVEKVAAMAARADLEESLFHPGDAMDPENSFHNTTLRPAT